MVENHFRRGRLATLSELQARRVLVLAALESAYQGKSYSRGSAGGSSLAFVRQDITSLRTELDRIDGEIAVLSGSRAKIVYVRPRDD